MGELTHLVTSGSRFPRAFASARHLPAAIRASMRLAAGNRLLWAALRQAFTNRSHCSGVRSIIGIIRTETVAFDSPEGVD